MFLISGGIIYQILGSKYTADSVPKDCAREVQQIGMDV